MGRRAKKGRCEVVRKFLHVPPLPGAPRTEGPRGTQARDPACAGAVLAAREHSKANCPCLGRTFPGLSLATVFTWELRSPSRPEANVLAIKNACCIPGCPHPDPVSFHGFGKTCPSCLLGQIPGQAAQPAGNMRAGRTAPCWGSSPEAVAPSAGRSAASSGSCSRCVWDGRMAHVPRELLSGQIPHLAVARTDSTGFCLTEPMGRGGAKSEQQIQGGLCPPFRTRGVGVGAEKEMGREGLRAQLTERGLWR